ncbi:MAG TPA: hypothetical protein VE444_08335 [Gaiellaceae bacterium]|jgi:L-alanine-DL-glutamate epimerase-like enolase superfamily enzyme|nr:hypothetical protein [Gaiellaceae bacterium]
MSDYERLAELPVQVDGYTTERRELATGRFTRVTTTVVLTGGGVEGRGEDVIYEAELHDTFPLEIRLDGTHTVDSLSSALEEHDLHDYRRWAFESAALDLALRQAGKSLGEAVGREYRPVRFVASTSGDIREWLAVEPGLEFKVDTNSRWTRELMEELAATGSVRCVDMKGHYVGEWVDRLEPPQYADVLEAFTDAVIEDPLFDDTSRDVLHAAAERLSFDAPIHSVADIEALPVEPGYMNIKPSRFGSCRRLFEAIAHCEARGVRLYGGGQFELGVGREHIQAIASLYYPDGANDVAPSVYNEPPPRAGLPQSPLEPAERPVGLAFAG